MKSDATSRRLGRANIVPLIGAVFLSLQPSAPAQDLTELRAAVKQRSSLLQTLDVKFRVWEDMEYRMLPGEPEPLGGAEARIHWAIDRSRVFFEVTRGNLTDSLFYDGQATLRLVPDPDTPAKAKWAFIEHAPPKADVYHVAVLPQLLGLVDTYGAGDLNAILSADDSQIDSAWKLADAHFDVAITCIAKTSSMPRIHLGFASQHGLALAVLHYEWSADESAMWLVDEWMAVHNDLTGDELWVPRRGRWVMDVNANGKQHRQALVVNVDQFNVPARITSERFVATIPPGTEVWEASKVPGQPSQQYIAGGAAAVEAQAAEAARKADAAMAELLKTGVTFSGRPQRGSTSWLFSLIGIVLLACALFWSRWQKG